jgi:hypothetical protein
MVSLFIYPHVPRDIRMRTDMPARIFII